jgi:hypothetical protein
MRMPMAMTMSTLVFELSALMGMSVIMIMIMSWSLMQNVDENKVEDQTKYGCYQHDFSFNIIIYKYSIDSFDEQINRNE